MKWWRELLAVGWICWCAAPAKAQDLPAQLPPPEQELPAAGPELVDRTQSAEFVPGYLGLKADDQGPGDGLRVVEVKADGPAARAGLRVGDLITSVQQTTVRSLDEFAKALSSIPAGERVTFDIVRGQVRQRIDVTLGRRPSVAPPQLRLGSQAAANAQPDVAPLGLRVEALSNNARQARGIASAGGVQVTRVTANSAAAKAGIMVDAVIVSIDGQPVASPDDAARMLSRARVGRPISFALVEKGESVERQVRPESAAAAPTAREPVLPDAAKPAPPGDRVAGAHARITELEERVSDLEQKLAALQAALEKFRDDVK